MLNVTFNYRQKSPSATAAIMFCKTKQRRCFVLCAGTKKKNNHSFAMAHKNEQSASKVLKVRPLQTLKQVHLLSKVREPFENFVDSPYYSESELCGRAMTASFSKYLPWQAMHFLKHSTHF
jgi:hypothetical protein